MLLICTPCSCDNSANSQAVLFHKTGHFSIAVPAGWQTSRPIGIPFAVIHGPADEGLKPNIFTDRITDSVSLAQAADSQLALYKNLHKDHYILAQPEPFVTKSGLPGLKTSACRTNSHNQAIALFHYAILDNNRVIQLTASCAESSVPQNENLFDAAIRSIRPED